MNWYINRKTNELVQAIWEEDVNGKDYSCWFVYKDGRKIAELNVADFQSQYGEAMVNNPMIPADDKPHIKDKFCDNLGCIPYIPEQKQADEEPVFPICGTCNARKDSKPDSSLLLSGEEIKAFVKEMGWRDNPAHLADIISRFKAFQERLLDHLAKLGIVYVKKECPYILSNCQGGGRCPDDFKRDGCVKYISLSDYMKGEGK